MKKNENMNANTASNLHERRSDVARHEPRDSRGRFTASTGGQSSNKRGMNKNDEDCSCTPTLGTSYTEQKFHNDGSRGGNNHLGSEGSQGYSGDYRNEQGYDQTARGNDDIFSQCDDGFEILGYSITIESEK